MPTTRGIRSFVAIDLPADWRSRLGEIGRALARAVPAGSVRWARPEGIHLTLKFLGDVLPADLPAIDEVLAATAREAAAFEITVGGLGCFPDARRPRVVWVGVEEPTGGLPALQAALEDGLARSGLPREQRAFHPHLTLGRVRPEAASSAAAVGAAVVAAPRPSLGSLQVGAICLFHSELRPGGAVYTRRGEYPLGVRP